MARQARSAVGRPDHGSRPVWVDLDAPKDVRPCLRVERVVCPRVPVEPLRGGGKRTKLHGGGDPGALSWVHKGLGRTRSVPRTPVTAGCACRAQSALLWSVPTWYFARKRISRYWAAASASSYLWTLARPLTRKRLVRPCSRRCAEGLPCRSPLLRKSALPCFPRILRRLPCTALCCPDLPIHRLCRLGSLT